MSTPAFPMRTNIFLAAVTTCALAGGLTGVQAQAAPAQRADAVQKSLNALVSEDSYPGALAAVRDATGRTRDYTAGVGDLETDEKVPVNGRVRIASNTKMFTATVVLQLVGEGKIDLDAPVERYLPGDGIDGRITVRHLLQHTSGLADYDDKFLAGGYPAVQHRHFEPQELVDVVLAEPALSAPGTKFSYSNANYVLAGLIVQKVTGRPIGEEITKRVIRKLGLRDTYWPSLGDQTIHGPHPHGYFPTGAEPTDVTEQDPSMGWAAGQLIATPRDLNTFMTALLDGKLLEPAQLAEMRTTVPAPDFDPTGTATYGLGLGTFAMSCGGVAWTHGGDAPGYVSRNAVTEDGKAATVVVTSNATSLEAAVDAEKALDTALCS
jgi:D-alanyl-D-alanine carboxypeptidase